MIKKSPKSQMVERWYEVQEFWSGRLHLWDVISGPHQKYDTLEAARRRLLREREKRLGYPMAGPLRIVRKRVIEQIVEE